MSESKHPITPEMKVSELLDLYPKAEETLLRLSPAFAKLRNPVLRRTVARVTSLSQAARVGGVDLGRLINELRSAAGVEPDFHDPTRFRTDPELPPDWWKPSRITLSFDARPVLEAGEKPLERVLRDFSRLPVGGIYELIAPFLPAPLIDLGKEKGLEVWCKPGKAQEFRVYFCRTGISGEVGQDRLVTLE